MSEPEATTPATIDDPNLLDDPLTVAARLRSESERIVDLDDMMSAFVNTSTSVLQVAEHEDRAAFDGRTSNTIGAHGSAAWAQKIHGTWQAQRAELAETEQSEAERIRLDPRLSDLGRTEALEGLAKRYAEARQKQLAQVEATVDEVIETREAACRRLVLGEAAPDERTPELRALERVTQELRISSFLAATASCDPKAFADAVGRRIQAGDPATPDLLELATHRLWSTAPEHARALASQARGAARERALAALRADPKRSKAVGELVLLRMRRQRIQAERQFYKSNPHGVLPVVTSTRG